MNTNAQVVRIRNSENPEKTREMIFAEMRRDFADWMTAKEDLVDRPAIELTQEDNEFAARALVPEVDPRNVEILISPERILIKGKTHAGEPGERNLMSSVAFPRPVKPNTVHAEFIDGVLAVRAEIAGASVFGYRPRAA